MAAPASAYFFMFGIVSILGCPWCLFDGIQAPLCEDSNPDSRSAFLRSKQATPPNCGSDRDCKN
ncbi:MAG: hypothetical protein ACI8X5_002289 [Planctomycetota bacterium]|jgi:hypothetical protein